MASPLMPVSFEDVLAARELLEGVVRPTPLEYSRALSDRAGVQVFLKCENLQRTGSFKIRGAYTRMSRLSDEEKARGVVAASAGNHAQGVALAAQLLGIRADGLHAARRAAAQGGGDAGVRRARCGDRAQRSTTAWSRRRRVRRGDRRGPDPPVRPPRHRRRAGHVRPGDPRAVPRRAHDPGPHRRRRAARRHRHRHEGASGRTCAWSASRPRRPRPTRRRWRPAARATGPRWPRWPTGSPSGCPARCRFAIVRELVDDVRTVSRGDRSRARCCSCWSGPSWSSSRPVRPPSRACSTPAAALRGHRWWRCCPAATSTRCCCCGCIRHGMAAAGRYLPFRRPRPRPPGVARPAARPTLAEVDANVLEVEHVRTGATLRRRRGRGGAAAGDQGPGALRELLATLTRHGLPASSSS